MRAMEAVKGQNPRRSKSKILDFDQAVMELAREHARIEKGKTKEIWFFPDKEKKEIRFVEVVSSAMPHEGEIMAYRFGPHPESRFPYWIAIGVIRPEDKTKLDPPRGWGAWDQAKRVWPEAARQTLRARP